MAEKKLEKKLKVATKNINAVREHVLLGKNSCKKRLKALAFVGTKHACPAIKPRRGGGPSFRTRQSRLPSSGRQYVAGLHGQKFPVHPVVLRHGHGPGDWKPRLQSTFTVRKVESEAHTIDSRILR